MYRQMAAWGAATLLIVFAWIALTLAAEHVTGLRFSGSLVTLSGLALGMLAAPFAFRRSKRLRRAIDALDEAPPEEALSALYENVVSAGKFGGPLVAEDAICRHLERLIAQPQATVSPNIMERVCGEIQRATGWRSRSSGLPYRSYVLAHIHAAAVIGGQRYVQPLADLAAIKPRGAGEEEVRAAAAEALRVVQARLGEANDHLLRPAAAPGETLLRPAEAAGTAALLRAVEGEHRQETSG